MSDADFDRVQRAVLVGGFLAVGLMIGLAALFLLGIAHAPQTGPQYFLHCEPVLLPTHVMGWKCWW